MRYKLSTVGHKGFLLWTQSNCTKNSRKRS